MLDDDELPFPLSKTYQEAFEKKPVSDETDKAIKKAQKDWEKGSSERKKRLKEERKMIGVKPKKIKKVKKVKKESK